MNTLLIDRKNMTLSQQRNVIRIGIDGARPKTIPLAQIKRIVISCNIRLESRLLRTLASLDISLVLINPRKPEEFGLLIGSGHNDASRRVKQILSSEDENQCRQYARYLVLEKIQNQKTLMGKMANKRPQYRYQLTKSADSLQRAINRLQAETLSLDSIRGIEGSAAAAYFNAYTRLFPDSFNFTHRNRRPPRAPVNALLSLSYTLADSLAGYLLQVHGYDLMIGFYHKLSYSRHSLSSDVIEPLRPIVDEWVLQQISRKNLRLGHFKQQNGGCYLNKSGRGRYYAAWEYEMKPGVIENIEQAIKELKRLLDDEHER